MKIYATIIGILALALVSGFSGLFIGYNVADNRFQEARLHMIAIQNQALAAKDAHIHQLTERNMALTNSFLDKLDTLSSSYDTFALKMQNELKQAIYTQCKVPHTGRELLKERVKEANKQ
ncbi:hypothetical protein PN823_004569 [Enterobacter hormaechei]|nr:hypothetical protein [Enterobacter hormaechei]